MPAIPHDDHGLKRLSLFHDLNSKMLHLRGEVALDKGQLATLTAVTRAASTLSGAGVITIIGTYAMSKHFRNPMHRLIVINAFYNAFDVICTMISTSGPKAGNPSALCQFQAFLNQMYVQYNSRGDPLGR